MEKRPEIDEYSAYYERYITLVPDGDLVRILKDQQTKTTELLERVSEEEGGYRYAPKKWSLKEVIGHITDTERIMSYRLLRIARGDSTPLVSFDQDLYVASANFDNLIINHHLAEFQAVRQSTLTLLAGLSDEGKPF